MNVVAACYVASLLLGSTILAICIKVTTVEKYVAAISQLAWAQKVPDPVRDMFGVKAPSIKALIDEAKRWEEVPNRREPLTIPMVQHVFHQGRKAKRLGRIDDLACVMSNWLIMGIQSGFRKSEWAQEFSTFSSKFQLNIDGSSKAFVIQDFVFWSKDKNQIHHLTKKELSKSKFVTVC